MKQNHIIHKVVVEIAVRSKQKANAIKDDINSFLTFDVFPNLEKYMEALPENIPGQTLQLSRLSLDIDGKSVSTLGAHLENSITEAFEKEFNALLKPIIETGKAGKGVDGHTEISLLTEQEKHKRTFLHFLENGYMPWWNSGENAVDVLRPSIFKKIISAAGFERSLASAMQKPIVRTRIVNQLTDLQIKQLCQIIGKRSSLFPNLETGLVKQLPQLPVSERNTVWAMVLNVLADHDKSAVTREATIFREIIKAIPAVKAIRNSSAEDAFDEVARIFPSLAENEAIVSMRDAYFQESVREKWKKNEKERKTEQARDSYREKPPAYKDESKKAKLSEHELRLANGKDYISETERAKPHREDVNTVKDSKRSTAKKNLSDIENGLEQSTLEQRTGKKDKLTKSGTENVAEKDEAAQAPEYHGTKKPGEKDLEEAEYKTKNKKLRSKDRNQQLSDPRQSVNESRDTLSGKKNGRANDKNEVERRDQEYDRFNANGKTHQDSSESETANPSGAEKPIKNKNSLHGRNLETQPEKAKGDPYRSTQNEERQTGKQYVTDMPDHEQEHSQKPGHGSENYDHKSDEEGAYYVQNAGLILVHPFINNLFKYCGLADPVTQKLIDAELCVHLLHYIATGKTNQPESSMLFEKFLCNIPIQQSISRHIKLSRKHKSEAKKVVAAVQENWSAMKKASVELLQYEFFQRSGKLVLDDNLTLTIERKAQDILLDRLSWGFSLVKLPWKKDFLFVNW